MTTAAAQREAAEQIVFAALETEAPEFSNADVVDKLWIEAIQPGDEREQFACAESFGHIRPVGDVGEAALGLFGMQHSIDAVDEDAPARRHEQPGNHLDRCGLASTVWAEKADDLARLERDVETVDGGPVSKRTCQ